MNLGKQYYYCINCGIKQYTGNLSMSHVKSMLCSDKCREEYELKYARCILRKDAEEKKDERNGSPGS